MSDRAHYLDATRAIVLFLGVPYHALRLYTGEPWVVASDATSEALAFVGRVIHGFRLPVFFVVAGFFSLVLVERWGGREWLRSRGLRLGVPLVTGVLLLNPIQQVFHHRFDGSPAVGWSEAASLAVRGLAVPGTHLVAHLWFLIDLLLISAGFVVVRWLATPARLARGAAWVAGARGVRPVAAGVVGLAVLGLYNLGVFGSLALLREHRLVFFEGLLDLHRILGYVPFFALGALLAARAELLGAFVRLSWTGTFLAVAAATAMGFVPAGDLDAPATAAVLVCSPAVGVLMTHALLSWTHRFLDRSSRTLRVLVDSTYTVYLVHQPIVVALGFFFLGVTMPPVAEALVIAAATACVSVAVHRLIAPRPLLLFLFNGVRPKSLRAVTAPGGTAA